MSSKVNRRSFLGTTSALAAGASLLGATSEAHAAEKKKEDLSKLGKTPNTKFAVNVEMWWRKLKFMDRIKKAAEFGYPAIEFWPYKNKDIDAVARLCKKLKIEIAQFTAWGFTPGMNNPKNHARFEKQIEEACGVAKKLSCRKMTVVGGNDQRGMTQKQMHDNIITALKKVKPIVEEHQVMLILEPMNIRVDHKGHCLYGSAGPLRICREVDSKMVKLNWDLYHMQITEGDLCRHMKEGFDQIGYLQLADNPGRNEPGTGEVNYSRVLKEAAKLGYKDFVGLECRPTEEVAAAKRIAAADVW